VSKWLIAVNVALATLAIFIAAWLPRDLAASRSTSRNSTANGNPDGTVTNRQYQTNGTGGGSGGWRAMIATFKGF
jgi:hypothetical protein